MVPQTCTLHTEMSSDPNRPSEPTTPQRTQTIQRTIGIGVLFCGYHKHFILIHSGIHNESRQGITELGEISILKTFKYSKAIGNTISIYCCILYRMLYNRIFVYPLSLFVSSLFRFATADAYQKRIDLNARIAGGATDLSAYRETPIHNKIKVQALHDYSYHATH